MRAAEFVKWATRGSGTWSLARLSRAYGVVPSTLSSSLNRDADMKAGKLAALGELLGWELVMVPRGSRLPAGAVRIDPMPRGEGGE